MVQKKEYSERHLIPRDILNQNIANKDDIFEISHKMDGPNYDCYEAEEGSQIKKWGIPHNVQAIF